MLTELVAEGLEGEELLAALVEMSGMAVDTAMELIAVYEDKLETKGRTWVDPHVRDGIRVEGYWRETVGSVGAAPEAPAETQLLPNFATLYDRFLAEDAMEQHRVELPPGKYEVGEVIFSDFLDDISALSSWEAALDEIQAVHSVASKSQHPLKTFPVHLAEGRAAMGTRASATYTSKRMEDPDEPSEPFSITLDPEMPDPERSLVHEVGHWVDQQVLGEGHFASEAAFAPGAPEELVAVMWRIVESAAIRSLLLKRGDRTVYSATRIHPNGEEEAIEYSSDAGYIDYMTEPPEMFARAYSQWIGARNGNADATQTWTLKHGSFYAMQWDDDDFEPIAVAFDQLFAARGLLKPGVAPTSEAKRVWVDSYVRGGKPVEGYWREGMSDVERVQSVADALDGFQYGGFRTTAGRGSWEVSGRIEHEVDGSPEHVGNFRRKFDPTTNKVYHSHLRLDDDYRAAGFAAAFLAHSEAAYREAGFDTVEVDTADVGGYAWARAGFAFTSVNDYRGILGNAESDYRRGEGEPDDPRPQPYEGFHRAEILEAGVPEEVLDGFLARIPPREVLRDLEAEGKLPADLPPQYFRSESEIAAYGREHPFTSRRARHWKGKLWLGKAVLLGTSWRGRKSLLAAKGLTAEERDRVFAEVHESWATSRPDGAPMMGAYGDGGNLFWDDDDEFWDEVEKRCGSQKRAWVKPHVRDGEPISGHWRETEEISDLVSSQKVERAWQEALSLEEDQAVQSYENGAYRAINTFLRTGEDQGGIEARQAELVTAALAKASLPEAVSVFRGTVLPTRVEAGDLVIDQGFASTSLSEGAARLALRRLHQGEGHPTMMRIEVPEGAEAAYLGGGFGYGPGESAYEVLLQRESAVRVEEVVEREGIRYVSGRLVVGADGGKRVWIEPHVRDGEPVAGHWREVDDVPEASSNLRKYPRTYHLPWSPGWTDDDKVLRDTSHFEGKEVVVTEKMDGENTSMYRDAYHARSLDSSSHPTQSWARGLWGSIRHEIPPGWRLTGENLQGLHSIKYNDLPGYFFLFGVYDENDEALPWVDTVEVADMLGLPIPKVLWRGTWDEKAVRGLTPATDYGEEAEGYVVRLAEGFPASDFPKSVAKFVRESHVQTDEHWRTRKPEYNALAKSLKRVWVKPHVREGEAVEGYWREGDPRDEAPSRRLGLLADGELAKIYDGFRFNGLEAMVIAEDEEDGAREVEGMILHQPEDGGGPLTVGQFKTTAFRENGKLVLQRDLIQIQEEFQGRGFATAFYAHEDAEALAYGVERIELAASLETGGYTWARAGFVFQTDPDERPELGRAAAVSSLWEVHGWTKNSDEEGLEASIGEERATKLRALRKRVGEEAWKEFASKFPSWEQLQSGRVQGKWFSYEHEIAAWGRDGERWEEDGHQMWLGKAFLLGAGWEGVRYLPPAGKAAKPKLDPTAALRAAYEAARKAGTLHDSPDDIRGDDDEAFWQAVEDAAPPPGIKGRTWVEPHARDGDHVGGHWREFDDAPLPRMVRLTEGVSLYHVSPAYKRDAILTEGLRPTSEVGVSDLLAGSIVGYEVDGTFLATAEQALVLVDQMKEAEIEHAVFEAYLPRGREVYEDELMPEGSLIAPGGVPKRHVEEIDAEALKARSVYDPDIPSLFS